MSYTRNPECEAKHHHGDKMTSEKILNEVIYKCICPLETCSFCDSLYHKIENCFFIKNESPPGGPKFKLNK